MKAAALEPSWAVARTVYCYLFHLASVWTDRRTTNARARTQSAYTKVSHRFSLAQGTHTWSAQSSPHTYLTWLALSAQMPCQKGDMTVHKHMYGLRIWSRWAMHADAHMLANLRSPPKCSVPITRHLGRCPSCPSAGRAAPKPKPRRCR